MQREPDLTLEPDEIPDDFEVRPLRTAEERAVATGLATCGTCELSWDDDIVTGMTPAPSARCPFEAFHLDPDEMAEAEAEEMESFVATIVIDVKADDYEEAMRLARSAARRCQGTLTNVGRA